VLAAALCRLPQQAAAAGVPTRGPMHRCRGTLSKAPGPAAKGASLPMPVVVALLHRVGAWAATTALEPRSTTLVGSIAAGPAVPC
jgi:hypothetical protein